MPAAGSWPRGSLTNRAAQIGLLLGVACSFAASGQGAVSQSGPEGEPVKVEGYADFRHGGVFVIDGQSVRVWADTEIGGDVRNPAEIRLGYEVVAEGVRLEDGTILATHLEAKRRTELPEARAVVATADGIERRWVGEAWVYATEEESAGPLLDDEQRLGRVTAILDKLRPSYVGAEDVRAYVVDSPAWNAAAMANGSIWAFAGLIDAMSDDELAIILGHELAHYTHEHLVRQADPNLWRRAAAGLAASLVGSAAGGGTAAEITDMAAAVGTQAWTNGYSRDLEDQADRVGLRYAYEAGYDVFVAPILWARFRDRFGETDAVTSYLLASHSRPSDRLANVERELAANYRRTPVGSAG